MKATISVVVILYVFENLRGNVMETNQGQVVSHFKKRNYTWKAKIRKKKFKSKNKKKNWMNEWTNWIVVKFLLKILFMHVLS